MSDPNLPIRLSPDAVLLPGQTHAATGLDVVVRGGRVDSICPRGHGDAPSVALPGQPASVGEFGSGLRPLAYRNDPRSGNPFGWPRSFGC